MNQWEFPLHDGGGTPFGQTAVAEGADEESAAASAAKIIVAMPGAVLTRPGVIIADNVAARWREVASAFPAVASDAGRLACYARGLPLDHPASDRRAPLD
jgi:hypothetical protein